MSQPPRGYAVVAPPITVEAEEVLPLGDVETGQDRVRDLQVDVDLPEPRQQMQVVDERGGPTPSPSSSWSAGSSASNR
jgi:hypothetical protein